MPTALVLSAGGMYGAWQVGVWKALREHIQFDLIVGASAGAWNGWAIASGLSPDDLIREWMDPVTGTVMQFGLHSTGFLLPKNLHEKSRELYTRGHLQIPFGLTLAGVPRLRAHLIRDSEITWRHLAAACSIPLAFPPVKIEGKYYVDGGLLGACPTWAAEEMGATHAIAVNAINIMPFRLMRMVIRPRPHTAALKVFTIEPSTPLGSLKESVVWSPSTIRRWIDQGECDGNRAATSFTTTSFTM